MISRRLQLSRQHYIGILLLASMLFYVSGAALGLHLKLEHSHKSADIATATCCVDSPGREGADHPAPADSPTTPSKKHCAFCDMLVGITKPLAIHSPPQMVIPLACTGRVTMTNRTCVCHLTAQTISRRGPPAEV